MNQPFHLLRTFLLLVISGGSLFAQPSGNVQVRDVWNEHRLRVFSTCGALDRLVGSYEHRLLESVRKLYRRVELKTRFGSVQVELLVDTSAARLDSIDVCLTVDRAPSGDPKPPIPDTTLAEIREAFLTYLRDRERTPFLDSLPLRRPFSLDLLSDAESLEVSAVDLRKDNLDAFGPPGEQAITGRVAITDPALQDSIIRAVRQGIDEGSDDVYLCFDPRHGVRIRSGEEHFELALCFECDKFALWWNNRRLGSGSLSQTPCELLNRVLRDAGIEPTEGSECRTDR